MLCVWVCVFIHTLDLKAMEKWLLLVLGLARTKHFMLSMKHIFCVFTSGSDSDILDLIRVLHQSGGNVQVLFLYKMLYSKIQWSKLYPYRRFSGPGRHFMYLKVFPEFSVRCVCIFLKRIRVWTEGITGRQKSAWRREEWEEKPSSDWFNLSPLLKRFRNNAPSIAIVC